MVIGRSCAAVNPRADQPTTTEQHGCRESGKENFSDGKRGGSPPATFTARAKILQRECHVTDGLKALLRFLFEAVIDDPLERRGHTGALASDFGWRFAE